MIRAIVTIETRTEDELTIEWAAAYIEGAPLRTMTEVPGQGSTEDTAQAALAGALLKLRGTSKVQPEELTRPPREVVDSQFMTGRAVR